jgi:Icc-related predicted phosphoesterase
MGARLGWTTDLHLNFVDEPARLEFYTGLKREHLDALLLGGDIGEADSVETYLSELAHCLDIPVYFVLGNHDFYGSSIRSVRARIHQLTSSSTYLHWLTTSGVIQIDATTAIVGHDSWADGRLGDFFGSDVLLNDFFRIEELRLDKSQLYSVLNNLGDEAARYLAGAVRSAAQSYSRIIVLTHVPPFRESCWHEGSISGDAWLPHFACKSVGQELLRAAEEHPQCAIAVLCGHTHSSGFAEIRDNLVVRTGGAVYGTPQLQQIFEFM